MSTDTTTANESWFEDSGPYDRPIIRIRRFRMQSTDIPLSLIVDATGRILVPQNPPTNSLKPPSKLWKNVGKHTFRLVTYFHPLANPSSRDVIEHMGTVIHIGQGLFLTNMHIMKWVEQTRYSHHSHKARTWLFSGKGNLDTASRNPKDPTFFSRGPLEVKVIGWSPESLAHASGMGFGVQGGLMDSRYKVPPLYDFCLLAPVNVRWEKKLRKTESTIHPESLSLISTTAFPATLVAINGSGSQEHITKYNLAVNTPTRMTEAIKSLHPGKVTFASTNQAIKSLSGPGWMPVPPGTNGDVIRYPLGTTAGSSGSGLYNSNSRNLIGIHNYGELDPNFLTSTSPNNCSVAVSLTSPAFVNFARTIIIPALEQINTVKAAELVVIWTNFCNSAI